MSGQSSKDQAGIEFSPIVFGGNVFGWGADEVTSFALIDAALERGVHCIDTADIYSYWAPGNRGGESEAMIGKWLQRGGQRDRIAIHTKGGAPDAPGEFANAKLTADYLTRAVDASLQRLQTDYIDLYYVHYDDALTPPEETLKALEHLHREGKIRAIGASNFEPERLRSSLEAGKALGIPSYGVFQTLYNLYDRVPYEDALESLCQEFDVAVTSYFSLASGFLSGKYRSEADLAKSASRGSAVQRYLDPRGLRILAALDAVADRYRATPAQIALAWLIAHPSIAAPITSATSLAQLDDLLQCLDIRLDAAALTQLDTASAPA